MKIRCGITGAKGYLGSRLKEYFEKQKIEVISLSRSRSKDDRSICFSLGSEVMVESLRGLDALVHCAYDFSVLGWSDILRVNVEGTRRLFQAAGAAGVKKIIFVSSMSAFPDCKSLYGRAKLLGEAAAVEIGAMVVKPGLIYDAHAGGMVGALRSVIKKSSWVPILRTEKQRLYLLHSRDFCRFIFSVVSDQIHSLPRPVALAHPQGFALEEIVRILGESMGKDLLLLPVPNRLVYAVLKTAETLGFRGRLRSDAVQSLLYCDPAPSFSEMSTLKFEPAEFSAESLNGALA